MKQFTIDWLIDWLIWLIDWLIDHISAVTKDIFVWTVGPRRSVNYFNCAA